MSGRPPEPDKNYYDKVIRYEHSLGDRPRVIKPDTTARSLAVKEMKADESVFHYADNGVARAGLVEFTRRLELEKIAIIGLGGTGSYILDLVAKTPVKEIHLFDDDVSSTTTRSEHLCAPTLDELRTPPLKVNYFAGIYGRMHRGIRPHPDSLAKRTSGFSMEFVSPSSASRTPRQRSSSLNTSRRAECLSSTSGCRFSRRSAADRLASGHDEHAAEA